MILLPRIQAPIPISTRQMAKFRQVSAAMPASANNYRPVQPLNGRQILDVIATAAAAPAAASAAAAVSVVLGVVVAKMV